MVRKARPDDFEQIWNIYTQHCLDITKLGDTDYIAGVQKQGFSLCLSDQEDIQRRILESTVFNVFDDGLIKGYVNIQREYYFPEEAINIQWLDAKLKKYFFTDPKTSTLHLIATHKDHFHQGIATRLWQATESEIKRAGIEHIFSIITSGPVMNCASIIFHSKMGFERACVTAPKPLFGMEHYESILFYKNIH